MQPTYGLIIMKIVEIFDPRISSEEKTQMMIDNLAMSIGLSVAVFLTSYGSFALLQISSERLSFKLRAKYLASLMRQEVPYFEKQQVEALPSKMAEYFTHIAEGSGEKCGQLITTVGASVSGVIIGLCICPWYALAVLGYGPVGTIIMIWAKNAMVRSVIEKMGQNARLGAFTEEMLSSLKLIISFGKEKMKLKEYE